MSNQLQQLLQALMPETDKTLDLVKLAEETKEKGSVKVLFLPMMAEIIIHDGAVYVFQAGVSPNKGRMSALIAHLTFDRESELFDITEEQAKAGLRNLMDMEAGVIKMQELLAERGALDILDMSASDIKEANANFSERLKEEGETFSSAFYEKGTDDTEAKPTVH